MCPFVCRIRVTPDTTLTIDNTVMRPDTLTSVSQLGPSVSFDVIVFNEGPSTAPGARLMISWPLNISEPSDSYILYPTSVSVHGNRSRLIPYTTHSIDSTCTHSSILLQSTTPITNSISLNHSMVALTPTHTLTPSYLH